MTIWKQVKGNFFTPGGDPLWECPKCGFTHLYGIECTETFKNKCDKCGIDIIYPWQTDEKDK